MKNVKMILAAVILASVSVSSFAAMETTMPQGKTLIGRVSDSSGSTTLSELNANLAAKAQAAGASSYRIVAAGGNNVLFGTADIYK
ncbi:multiple stress resistance protein BhsA [Pantoea agglomerans]|uniref:multiple stress resistance protein BhsA n=1 Tax=Enterobacter agglomerans TaxID=549 RepID=UPI003DA08841